MKRRSTNRLFALFLIVACLTAPAAGQELFGVKIDRNVQYGVGGDVPLELDLVRPAEQKDAAACVVFIHGGAWRGGNKVAHLGQAMQQARRGYVAATIAYRLCPEHRFPAQVEDVKCAIRFLRAHADEYQIDPERIAAVGFSAGAHLSMMLGTMDPDDGFEGEGGWPDRSSKVQAVVSFFGPTDLAADDIPQRSIPLVSDFIGGSVEEKPEQYAQASPLTYVSGGDAPMLLLQGTRDPLVPHTQATRFADAMTAAGVPGRVELLIGAGHGWGGNDKDRTTEAMNDFLDRHLK